MADTPKYVLYHYNPSFVAAVIFIVLFIATTTAHMYQLFKRRTWYFIPFVVGGFFEFIGYIGRAINSKQTPNWNTSPYIMQSVLLLLAPAVFAASIYMVLGRIILLTDGETHSLIRAKWLTKFFVAGDVLSFFTQSGGGGIIATAKTASTAQTGSHVITGGLIIQLLFFGFFIFVAGIFHRRIVLCPTAVSRTLKLPWQQYLVVLYAASALIIVRSAFRVVEYVQGNGGYLLGHEAYAYVFDATLMFVVMVLFNVYHPWKIISKGKGQLKAGVVPVAGGSDVEMGRGEAYGLAGRNRY